MNTWVLSWKEPAFFRSISASWILQWIRPVTGHTFPHLSNIPDREMSHYLSQVLLTLDKKEALWIRMMFSGDAALGDVLVLQKGWGPHTEEKPTLRNGHTGWNPTARTHGHALPGRLKFLQDPQGSVAGMTDYKKDRVGWSPEHYEALQAWETNRIFRLFQAFPTCEEKYSYKITTGLEPLEDVLDSSLPYWPHCCLKILY